MLGLLLVGLHTLVLLLEPVDDGEFCLFAFVLHFPNGGGAYRAGSGAVLQVVPRQRVHETWNGNGRLAVQFLNKYVLTSMRLLNFQFSRYWSRYHLFFDCYSSVSIHTYPFLPV